MDNILEIISGLMGADPNTLTPEQLNLRRELRHHLSGGGIIDSFTPGSDASRSAYNSLINPAVPPVQSPEIKEEPLEYTPSFPPDREGLSYNSPSVNSGLITSERESTPMQFIRGLFGIENAPEGSTAEEKKSFGVSARDILGSLLTVGALPFALSSGLALPLAAVGTLLRQSADIPRERVFKNVAERTAYNQQKELKEKELKTDILRQGLISGTQEREGEAGRKSQAEITREGFGIEFEKQRRDIAARKEEKALDRQHDLDVLERESSVKKDLLLAAKGGDPTVDFLTDQAGKLEKIIEDLRSLQAGKFDPITRQFVQRDLSVQEQTELEGMIRQRNAYLSQAEKISVEKGLLAKPVKMPSSPSGNNEISKFIERQGPPLPPPNAPGVVPAPPTTNPKTAEELREALRRRRNKK